MKLKIKSKEIYCDKECRVNADKCDGHFKAMSVAGHDGRIKSLKEKPRLGGGRKKNDSN